MEYIELAYSVKESYQDKRIMLVYASNSARHKAISRANESGHFMNIETRRLVDYDIISKTSGIIDVVSVSSGFTGSWSDVTDIWYDDSISDEEIRNLKRAVTRNSRNRYSVVTVPFSTIKSTYTLDEDIPIEEDVYLEEYLSELFSGSSSKEVRV